MRTVKPGTLFDAQHRGVDYIQDDASYLRFVYLLQLTILAGCVLAAGGVLIAETGDSVRLFGILAFAVIVLVSRWAVRFGPEPATILLASGLWAVNTAYVLLYAGVHSANVLIYPFLIGLAGWILGKRWLIALTMLTVVFLLVIGLAEYMGMYQPTPRANAIIVMLTAIAVTIVAAFLTHAAFGNFANRHQRVLEMAEQLGRHNMEISSRERLLQLVIDSVPAGIAYFDAESRLRMGNRRYAALFGSSPEVLVGKCLADYAPQPAMNKLMPYWKRCLREGIPQHYRRSNFDPVTGAESILDVELVPELVEDKVAGIFALLVDVSEKIRTERRLSEQNAVLTQREQEIRGLNETLEKRVELRAAELREAMQNLNRSQQDLARAERMAALGALVAGVSHELNTPIGNAVMAASTLDDHAKSMLRAIDEGKLLRSQMTSFLSQLRDGFSLLRRNLHRAEDLLRSFKQVAADQTSEQRRVFDLRGVVEEIVDTLSPSLKRKPHRIEVDLTEGIEMDTFPGPLGQVLINLVNNAYLHAFESLAEGGVVRIGSQRTSLPNDVEGVLIFVADNGKGIPESLVGRIFEPFFTTRMGQGGTGLGLSIVYSIVSGVLGGRIEVQSSVNQGTRFELYLPLVVPTAVAVLAV